MFVASLFRLPTAAEKAKQMESATKKKKDAKPRDRMVRLTRFDIDTNDASKAAEVVANTIAKAIPAKRAVVVAVDIRQVKPKSAESVEW